MAKLTASQKAQQHREKRDEKLKTLYSKIDHKTGTRKHSVRSLAEQFGMSKSRVHEIVRDH